MEMKDWSTPDIRKQLRVYPEIPEDGIIREIWHAQKWRKDIDLECLSPMYDAGSKHFYVNELARLQDGSWVLPIRWVTFRGSVYADAFSVMVDDEVRVLPLNAPLCLTRRIDQDWCISGRLDNNFDFSKAAVRKLSGPSG